VKLGSSHSQSSERLRQLTLPLEITDSPQTIGVRRLMITLFSSDGGLDASGHCPMRQLPA
jgi:hypothetical protein